MQSARAKWAAKKRSWHHQAGRQALMQPVWVAQRHQEEVAGAERAQGL